MSITYLFIFLYEYVCLCVYVYMHTCVPLPAEARKGYWTTGCGLSDMGGCWEPYLGPLEEQQVLLKAEPSLQFLRTCF